MADKKISDLTALTGANLAEDDLAVVVDTSTTTTKKMTVAELRVGLGQDQSDWNTGTSTTESTISPAKLDAKIANDIAAIPFDLEFIETQTASTSTSLDFTSFDASAYASYVFVVSNIIPATDNVTFQMRTSADGGSTFDSGASDYFGSRNGSAGSAADAISIVSGVGTAAGEDGVSCVVDLLGPDLAKKTMCTFTYSAIDRLGDFYAGSGGGVRDSSAAVDAVRFMFASGNIESGEIAMYGRRFA